LSIPRYPAKLSPKMSDGNILKPDKDLTNEADKIIPQAQEIAKVPTSHSLQPSHSTDIATDRYPQRH
jgi:hypothetical protein